MSMSSSVVEIGHAGTDARAWAAFASAGSREAFCRAWLELQCSMIPDAAAALLLLKEAETQSFVPAAVWPEPRRDVSYLSAVAERALSERRGVVFGSSAAERGEVAAGHVYVAYP